MYPVTSLPARNRRSHTVAEELLSLITTGQFGPGSRLPTETELCGQFKVSRTTLREAIQTLRARGFLDVSPGRGSFTRQPEPGLLLNDLILSLQLESPAPSEEQISTVLCGLLVNAIPAVMQASLSCRQSLFQYVVIQDANVTNNLELENTWQSAFLKLDGRTGSGLLMPTLLTILQTLHLPHRSTMLQQASEVSRTSQCQLRATTALVEGDAQRLHHALTNWLTRSFGITTNNAA